MNLSPLNFSRMLCRLRLPADETSNSKKPKLADRSDRAEMVMMYRCTDCGDLHEYRDDAEQCCASDAVIGLHDEEDVALCPVCGSDKKDNREAADCCLWRDFDAATRYRMADAVDAGSTWPEQLGVNEFGKVS